MNRRALVMAVVVLLHGLLLAAARFARFERLHHEDEALMVTLLRDPPPKRDEKPPAPAPVRLVAPMPAVIAFNAPAIEIPVIEATAAPAPAMTPAVQIPSEAPAPMPAVHVASAAPAPAAPENLGTELAVQCPVRTAPRYPLLAKRQREQGEVFLRVELDESGRIDRVTVVNSSGSPRLDDAAREAVESWRCQPAQRGGQPVRAVALQSFTFVLERR